MDRIMRLICIAGVVAIISGTAACAPIRYDHDLIGRVVDADNGEPIPGTVILREWIKRHITVAGGHGSFYEVRETVTDENGEFEIPGLGLRFFSMVGSHAYVFKAGYNWVGTDYERLQNTGGVIRLWNIMGNKKLMRKRLPPISEGPYKQQKHYIREIDKAYIMLGLKPSPYWNKENE